MIGLGHSIEKGVLFELKGSGKIKELAELDRITQYLIFYPYFITILNKLHFRRKR